VEEIRRILESSQRNNKEKGITGILCYNPHYFLQWIEGSRDAVNEIYANIVKDDRHSGCELIEYKEVANREFESWSMAYVSVLDVDARILFKYFGSASFEPHSMSGESAASFLLRISESVDD
jgi:hypothetical protein